jgi:hypothetical protein
MSELGDEIFAAAKREKPVPNAPIGDSVHRRRGAVRPSLEWARALGLGHEKAEDRRDRRAVRMADEVHSPAWQRSESRRDEIMLDLVEDPVRSAPEPAVEATEWSPV